MDEYYKALGKFFTVASLLILVVIMDGCVLSYIWSWLITPVFKFLPAITIAQGIGLSTVCDFIKFDITAKREENMNTWKTMLGRIGVAIIVLIQAWIISHFI